MKLNVASQNSQVAKLATNHTTSVLTIRSGAVPTIQGQAFGTALVTHTLQGFQTPSNGSITANAITEAEIVAAGTASHATLENGTETLLLSVGLAGSGAECIVSSLSFVQGVNSRVLSLVLFQPSGF
jgi:hypothetical protein